MGEGSLRRPKVLIDLQAIAEKGEEEYERLLKLGVDSEKARDHAELEMCRLIAEAAKAERK